MAALDLHEQEQLEGFKAWWRESRNFMLFGALIAVVAVGGWQGWKYYQNTQSRDAAILYAEFARQLDSNDVKRINDAAAAITGKFATSAYAARAALLAAQANEQRKDIVQAKTQLQWVMTHATEEGLKSVARLRLTAILLDEKNHVEALALLEAKHPASFDRLYADLRGDVLAAQGKKEEARVAYQTAIDKTEADSMYRNLIQLKLDALVAHK